MSATLKSLLQIGGGENDHNPLTMSDEQILDQIYSTHVHTDIKFDVDSLFTLVENTLRRSTQIVDNVVQTEESNGEEKKICSHLEVPNVAGKLPETIKCPDCPNTMEIYISYKCCHTGNTIANAIH